MYSFVIITKNRPEFLERILNYYSQQKITSPVLISAACDEEYVSETKNVINNYFNKLNISFSEASPKESPFIRLKNLADSVVTPYMAWVADDDFIVPSSIDKGVVILEENPDYSAVLGRAMTFVVEGDRVSGRIVKTGIYAQKDCCDTDPAIRLLKHMHRYTTTAYSLRRTSDFVKSMSIVNSQNFSKKYNYHFSELLDSLLTVIKGKIHMMPNLFLFRQLHDGMTSVKCQNYDDKAMSLIHKSWRSDVQIIISTLIEVINSELHMDKEKSKYLAVLAILDIECAASRKYINSELSGYGIIANSIGPAKKISNLLLKIGISKNVLYRIRENFRKLNRKGEERSIYNEVRRVVEAPGHKPEVLTD